MDATQRLFFALWLDEATRENIAAMLDQIALPAEARKVAAANLHLTLLFIGAADATLRCCLERAAAQLRGRRFALTLAHIGHWRQPRVVWLAPLDTPPLLLSLVQDLGRVVAACNFTAEAHTYRPHITLARKVKASGADSAVTPLVWNVRDFSLVESRAAADGVRYRVLSTWGLSDGS